MAPADQSRPSDTVTLTPAAGISSGCFFNLGARLARYTNNATYAQFAEEAWNWLQGVGFIDQKDWLAYDGAHVETNCTDINKVTFSYVTAILAEGAAFMYNHVR